MPCVLHSAISSGWVECVVVILVVPTLCAVLLLVPTTVAISRGSFLGVGLVPVVGVALGSRWLLALTAGAGM